MESRLYKRLFLVRICEWSNKTCWNNRKSNLDGPYKIVFYKIELGLGPSENLANFYPKICPFGIIIEEIRYLGKKYSK